MGRGHRPGEPRRYIQNFEGPKGALVEEKSERKDGRRLLADGGDGWVRDACYLNHEHMQSIVRARVRRDPDLRRLARRWRVSRIQERR